MTRVVSVIPLSPLPGLDRPFDYLVPEEIGDIWSGCRVRIPLGRQLLDGFVLEIKDKSDRREKLRPLKKLLWSIPTLRPDIWRLSRTLADRSCGTASDVLRLAIAPRQARIEKAYTQANKFISRLPPPTRSLLGDFGPKKAGARYSHLMRLGLDEQGYQSWAYFLLELAQKALEEDKSAILVVPNWRDQEQILELLAKNLPQIKPLRFSANQPPSTRYRAFLDCLSQRRQLVVGSRSALYAPVSRLGVLAVWNAEDQNLKDPRAPYPQARDVAMYRQFISGCDLHFLSFTPSLPIIWFEKIGWLRPPNTPVPRPKLYIPGPEEPDRLPSSVLIRLQKALRLGPVLVQVPRRGYAPSLECLACGEAVLCPKCGRRLAQDQSERLFCPSTQDFGPVKGCPKCSGQNFRMLARGHARTAQELGQAFPKVPLVLADGENPRSTISSQPQLVVATPQAAPRVRGGYAAVVVLDSQIFIAHPGIEAVERSFSVWAEALALLGNSGLGIVVGVEEKLTAILAGWQLGRYLETELADRRALRLPPSARIARLSGSASTIHELADRLQKTGPINLIGPANYPDRANLYWLVITFPPENTRQIMQILKSKLIETASQTIALRVRCDDVQVLDEIY